MASLIISGDQWNINDLGTEKFSISNQGSSNFATCSFGAKLKEPVLGRSDRKQWVIEESPKKGEYLYVDGDHCRCIIIVDWFINSIAPTDKLLYWGLQDGEMGSPVRALFQVMAPELTYTCRLCLKTPRTMTECAGI